MQLHFLFIDISVAALMHFWTERILSQASELMARGQRQRADQRPDCRRGMRALGCPLWPVSLLWPSGKHPACGDNKYTLYSLSLILLVDIKKGHDVK